MFKYVLHLALPKEMYFKATDAQAAEACSDIRTCVLPSILLSSFLCHVHVVMLCSAMSWCSVMAMSFGDLVCCGTFVLV